MRLRRRSISSISRSSTLASSKLPTALAASRRPLESAISRERFSRSIHSDVAIGRSSSACPLNERQAGEARGTIGRGTVAHLRLYRVASIAEQDLEFLNRPAERAGCADQIAKIIRL